MKKWFLFLGVLVLCSGCNKEETKTIKVTPTPTPVTTREPLPCEKENAIPLALYQRENGIRKKVVTHTHSLVLNEDFAVFSTFMTNEEEISGEAIIDLFPTYYQKIGKENVKIGYQIAFTLENETSVQKTILNPNDASAIYDYMQVYLYDDIHQKKGAWYSHVEEMKENTLLTTIKLTGSTYTNQIVSPITLTVFLYQGTHDFDSNQNYIGCHFYKTTIQRK